MNLTNYIYLFLLTSAFLSWHVKDTDAFGIIGKAIVIKAIIAAKIIAGAAALWVGRGGFGGFGGFGGGSTGSPGGAGGFFGFGRRRRESVERKNKMTNEDIERVFSIIINMDEQFCMARIICQIHAAKDAKKFGELGVGVREIFKHYTVTNSQPRNAATIYKQAATLGSLTDEKTCERVYNACELEPDQVITVIESANNLD